MVVRIIPLPPSTRYTSRAENLSLSVAFPVVVMDSGDSAILPESDH